VLLNGCAHETECCVDTVLGHFTAFALPSAPAFCTQLCTLKDTDLTLFLKTSSESVAKLSRIVWLVACFVGSSSLRESHLVELGLSARPSVRHVYVLHSHTACSACSNVTKFCFCLQKLCRLIHGTNRDSNSPFWPHSVCVSFGSYNKERLFIYEPVHPFIKIYQHFFRLHPSKHRIQIHFSASYSGSLHPIILRSYLPYASHFLFYALRQKTRE